jgi:hypothetical protein
MSKESKRADTLILAALVCGVSAEGAAAKAGVNARTVRRRLRDPAFVRKLNRMRTDVQMRTADQLNVSNSEAVRTMVLLMQPSHPPGVRLHAARSVIELGLKVRETADLSLRLSELEQRFDEQKGKQN